MGDYRKTVILYFDAKTPVFVIIRLTGLAALFLHNSYLINPCCQLDWELVQSILMNRNKRVA